MIFLNGVWQVRDFTVLKLFADFFWFWQTLIIKCLVKLNITATLTTKSPFSLEVSIQWTPQLAAVICFGTGLVCYSFVSERYTAALSSRCLVTLILCWGSFKYKDERTTKIQWSLNLAVYKFRKKRSRHDIITLAITWSIWNSLVFFMWCIKGGCRVRLNFI